MVRSISRRAALNDIWNAAIEAVSGYQAVTNVLCTDSSFNPDLVLAVGKAAVGMCQGALDNLPPCDALVVTKYDHADADIQTRERVRVIEAAHPIPDQKSLEAGQALLDRMRSMPADSRVLLLFSGGASALAESLPEGSALSGLLSLADAMTHRV